jgi:metal-responsive CopG/Arc/MetJ family transcriptional regulator
MCMYDECMRTTVEITDEQRAQLLKLAAQRGEKGFSSLIREALELYMRQHRARREAVAKALQVKGSFSDQEADTLEASVSSRREKWR